MKKGFVLFVILLAVTSYHPSQAQNWNQIIKACASDRDANDHFGYSVSISGDYAIVGARNEDDDVNGGVALVNAGSAYIFKHKEGNWTQVQKIVAADRAASDYFGNSVSISGDYAIVGASGTDEVASGGAPLRGAGSAYLFRNISGIWTQVQKLVASDRDVDDWFGFSVSISGEYAIIGTYGEDDDVSGGQKFNYAGAAYIFRNNAGTWTQVQKIVASDRAVGDWFGFSVSISGDYAMVGAYREDEDAHGMATLSEAGSAYIFKNESGTWTQVQKITAADRAVSDFFGRSVSISGDHVIVGAYQKNEVSSGGVTLSNTGSAFIFKNIDGTWVQVQKIVAADKDVDDFFGYSVSVSGDNAIVGAYQEDDYSSGGATLSGAGSAYIFTNDAGTWSQSQKIVASDRANFANFGHAVSISGDLILVGAYNERKDAIGMDPLLSAGSAYFFGPTPEINIQGNLTNIIDGATSSGGANHTDFGSTNTNTSITRTFTIENTGVGILYLTGNPKISLTGTAFSVTTDAPDFITSGNSATFQITFSPENVGDFFETVRIANNDQDENPYTFVISGTGIDHIPPDLEDPVVNLSEMELKGILIYPNPSSGIINLDFSACKALKISISDISGNLLMEKLVTSQQVKIDLSNYSKGMYVINIQTEKEVIVSKLIMK